MAGDIVPDEDMPWCEEDGIIPDIVFAPLGPVSRMTPSFQMSALTGKAICVTGDFELGVDKQNFETDKSEHMKRMGDILHDAGMSRRGTAKFRCGMTGDVLEGMVFVGVIPILRLNHQAETKCYCRSTGSVDPKTRQPRDGTLLTFHVYRVCAWLHLNFFFKFFFR